MAEERTARGLITELLAKVNDVYGYAEVRPVGYAAAWELLVRLEFVDGYKIVEISEAILDHMKLEKVWEKLRAEIEAAPILKYVERYGAKFSGMLEQLYRIAREVGCDVDEEFRKAAKARLDDAGFKGECYFVGDRWEEAETLTRNALVATLQSLVRVAADQTKEKEKLKDEISKLRLEKADLLMSLKMAKIPDLQSPLAMQLAYDKREEQIRNDVFREGGAFDKQRAYAALQEDFHCQTLKLRQEHEIARRIAIRTAGTNAEPKAEASPPVKKEYCPWILPWPAPKDWNE